jgi:dihydroorotate dehydrogenase
MIELAPHNKQGLALSFPLIAGSGAVGYADAWPAGIEPAMFGAIITSPISWRPRRGRTTARHAELPGGFLLATGDHNPGYRRVLQDHDGAWRRLGVPVIAALAASAPEDWERLAGILDEESGAAGLELHLPYIAHRSDAAAWIGAVRRASTLPLLVKLPTPRAVALAATCASAGADALVIGSAPMAAGLAADGTLVEGPAAGPAVFPFTLYALRAVAALDLGLPLVAAGGICRPEDAELCYAAGAAAVQVRSVLWTDPGAIARWVNLPT